MFQKHLWTVLGILVILTMLAAQCVAPVAAPPAAEEPAAEEPVAEAPAAEAKGTKFYWIQLLKGHPVHQLTQIAFMTGCKEQGLECEVVGPDEPDIQQTIATAEQVLAKGDAAGVAFWTGSPAFEDVIKKFDEAGIPVVAPHFPVEEGTWPANTVIAAADTADYPKEAADELCQALGDQEGSVAITQGSFNTTENAVAEVFTAQMNEVCPNVTVLAPEEEGFDPPKAIAKAVAIMQANPDLIGALSTTGGGPTTWAGAQKETGQQIPAIGMDYTRVNLDLVRDGEVFAVVGQPLWDESIVAAELLKKMAAGEEVPYWTVLSAPTITADELDQYYEMLDNAEAQMN
jgi:ribose transport system substrate-binding protein